MAYLQSAGALTLLALGLSVFLHRRWPPASRPPLPVHLGRWLLGLVFAFSGLAKLLPGFPNPIGPVWLEEALAPHGLALFARFIAVSEVGVGALLLVPRLAILGALALLPILSCILVATVSLGWQGTPFVALALLAIDGGLLFHDRSRLKALIGDRPD